MYRFLDLSNPSEDSFDAWLKQEAPYQQPHPPRKNARLLGGLRVVLCDRPNMYPGMSIGESTFARVESRFDLHPATVQMVVKVTQKVEIANMIVSLTYDVQTAWTDVFICGDGIVLARPGDDRYGWQGEQLMNAIALCGDAHMWTNPMLVPLAVLQMCARRLLTRTDTLEERVVMIENHLGVTFAGRAGTDQDRPDWPMDIDLELTTRELHSILPQALFLAAVTDWAGRFAHWLLDVGEKLGADPAMVAAGQQSAFREIGETTAFVASNVEGIAGFFGQLKGRTQSQIDLLFNVVGQRDALTSQRANELSFEVANSTKEDSISMSTFTFITAVFLPPSFVATMFSMGMFDWQDGRSETMSRKFWIFWVVAVPLTAVTIGGWKVWYMRSDTRWKRRLAQVNNKKARRYRLEKWTGGAGEEDVKRDQNKWYQRSDRTKESAARARRR
ncbi:hypothetical protein DV736_g4472, partial [Chaetothyriales sp. CBS 134916]